MTTGAWLMEAQPIPSIMREKPGPDVAVAARVPVRAAPEAIVTAAISSSVWTTRMDPSRSFAHAAVQLPEGRRLAPREDEPRLLPREALEADRELGDPLPREVVGLPGPPHVHPDELLLPADEAGDRLLDEGEVVLEEAEGRADGEHVHDAADLAQGVDLELCRDVLEEVLEGDGDEEDPALLRGREDIPQGLPEPQGRELSPDLRGVPAGDRVDVRDLRAREGRVADARPAVDDLRRMAEDGLRVERREELHVVDVGANDSPGGSKAEVRRPAHDV